MTVFLFSLRLLLYFSAVLIPVFHPGVTVPYDRPGIWLWFVLVPLEAVLGIFFTKFRNYRKHFLLGGILLLLVSLFFFGGPGFIAALETSLIALLVFLVTYFIFMPRSGGRGLFILEPAALGYLYYKMINFTRASQETSAQSGSLLTILSFLWVATFAVYLVLLFLAGFRKSPGKKITLEAGAVAGFLALALIIVSVLPQDFRIHDVVKNIFGEEARKDPVPLNIEGPGIPGGNLRGDQGEEGYGNTGEVPGGMGLEGLMSELFGSQGQGGQNQGEDALQGLDPSEWGRILSQGRGDGPQKQYAVMIVASPEKRLYMAGRYNSVLDAEKGFYEGGDGKLNALSERTLLSTWVNDDVPLDRGREQAAYSVWSAERTRYLPFAPFKIEPTVLQEKYNPFLYSYNGVSLYSDYSALRSFPVRELSKEERDTLGPYLSVPLSADDLKVFRFFAEKHLEQEAGALEKIDSIMRSFSTYQYEIGFTENVSIPALKRFLTDTKSGDCTEFSNVAALVGRIAGIPTRLVTGFLASRDLQSPPHIQGLMHLKEQMEDLSEYSLSELFLVTTMHRHSWVQFYVPPYGWVDFESTRHAIPPTPDMNPNAAQVVIPLLERLETVPRGEPFRWDIAGYIFLLAAVGIFFSGYLILGGKYLYLSYASRKHTRKGINANAQLLLFKMRRAGCVPKLPGETLTDYSERYNRLREQAQIHNTLLYAPSVSGNARLNYWDKFRKGVKNIPKHYRKPGLIELLKRIFSYRGLFR